MTGTPQYATDGNPATNIPATMWPAYQYNAFQEELIAIIEAAGITPDRTTNAQVIAAIKRLCQNTIVLADTGTANTYKAANATPLVAGTWVDGVVQAVKIAHTNTGASTYAPDGLTAIPIYGLGLQALQGGELLLNGTAILMHATIAGVNSGNPICVLMECAGGAQQVAPATASQQAVNLGQFVTSLATSGYVKIPNSSGLPLILQWFPIGNTGGSTSSGTFPLAFPNNCFAVNLTGLQAAGNTQAYAVLNNKSLTGFNWNAFFATGGTAPSLGATSGNVQGYGFAIGN
ncbi:hypothetical protein PQR64_24065 [Paraburkholderia phytofirmans]|uniref:gp53-like domain-containing protein n=1 Tax=Paraburkholderia phytofirmans TaxID=261302 RepID=UPI0038BBA538